MISLAGLASSRIIPTQMQVDSWLCRLLFVQILSHDSTLRREFCALAGLWLQDCVQSRFIQLNSDEIREAEGDKVRTDIRS